MPILWRRTLLCPEPKRTDVAVGPETSLRNSIGVGESGRTSPGIDGACGSEPRISTAQSFGAVAACVEFRATCIHASGFVPGSLVVPIPVVSPCHGAFAAAPIVGFFPPAHVRQSADADAQAVGDLIAAPGSVISGDGCRYRMRGHVGAPCGAR